MSASVPCQTSVFLLIWVSQTRVPALVWESNRSIPPAVRPGRPSVAVGVERLAAREDPRQVPGARLPARGAAAAAVGAVTDLQRGRIVEGHDARVELDVTIDGLAPG